MTDSTHYDALGVGSDADRAQVRRAYLALIKRHHPDLTGDQAGRAAVINEAYWWLGNVDRRLQYDLHIRNTRVAALEFKPVASPPWPIARNGDDAPARWQPRGRILGYVSVAAAALALLVYAQHQNPEFARSAIVEQEASPLAAAAHARNQEQRRSLVQEAILDFDWVSTQSRADGAELYSRRCYAELSRGGIGTAEYCVAFDAAGEHALGARGGYFGAEPRRARFDSIAGLLDGDPADRWREIELLVSRVRAAAIVIPAAATLWKPLARSAAVEPFVENRGFRLPKVRRPRRFSRRRSAAR